MSEDVMSTIEDNHDPEGADFLLDFWEQKYLQEFIHAGGSKIKFVTGRKGSGKTWFLQRFAQRARADGYVTAAFSAERVWLNDFRSVYLEILQQCDLDAILYNCAMEIVRQMGYDPDEIPDGQTFMDYLSGIGQADGITRRELRNQLKEMFLQNSLLDNNFAMAASLMTGGILGHPMLEPANKEILVSWLHGDKEVKLSLLRALNLSPSRITKYNARHMLRSLAEIIRIGGGPGLAVIVDDLEILQNKEGNGNIRYTKVRREDTYESIRQLIDEIDTMRGIIFVYGFDRILLDNENAGFKSYQALWMRVQNEIHGTRFNRFADIADLDQLAYQEYTPSYLVKIADGKITLEQAQKILEESRTSASGVPALVLQAVKEPAAAPTILRSVENTTATNKEEAANGEL